MYKLQAQLIGNLRTQVLENTSMSHGNWCPHLFSRLIIH